MKSLSKSFGFTLVELAIVIVIIGLLVGGVMQGQELIQQAQIRTAIKDFVSFRAAYVTFKSKYDFVPGDSATASNFISGAVNCSGNCRDGYLGTYSNQSIRSLNNLTSAGLIKGNFPGTQADFSGGGCSKTECPIAAFSGNVYFPVTTNITNPPSLSFDNTYRNGILIYAGINIDSSAGISPETAYQLDLKMDDGVPAAGYILGIGAGGFWTLGGYNSCSTTSGGTAYNLTITTKTCRPFYVLE